MVLNGILVKEIKFEREGKVSYVLKVAVVGFEHLVTLYSSRSLSDRLGKLSEYKTNYSVRADGALTLRLVE